jgi:outer membrane immunogenic protein
VALLGLGVGIAMSRIRIGLLASTALVLLGGQSAEAAPPIPYDWTGFYAGGNLGYSWGHLDTTTTVSPAFPFPGGSIFTPLSPVGFIGGGQIGYNRQVAPRWVVGVEADWQWSGETRSGSSGFGGNTPFCTANVCSFTDTTDITAKLSWFATVRGRAGLLVLNDNVLIYGTGGLAVGEVSVSGINALNAGVFSTPFNYSVTNFGYVIGAGAEGRIGMSRWTWKVEYLHMDLGSIGGGSFGTLPLITMNTTRFTDDILRVGFNYQFGTAPHP